MPEEHFKKINDDELCEMLSELQKPNTMKADKKCETAFMAYLSTRDDVENLDYWLFEPAKLDKILSQYWYEMKKTEGAHYRVSSLKHMRYVSTET